LTLFGGLIVCVFSFYDFRCYLYFEKLNESVCYRQLGWLAVQELPDGDMRFEKGLS